MMKNIPIDLKNAICNNQLIIFVGAGLSYNLLNNKNQQLKGWSNLVTEILLYLKRENYDVDHLIALVEKYDPIKVLDLIEFDKNIPKDKIYKFTKEFLYLNANNNVTLHKKIYELSKKIITTNYDKAFEIAVPSLEIYTAYKGRNYELITHKDPDSSLLFKLHGCFKDVGSMVLFPSDYNNLYKNTDRDAEHSLSVFRNIVTNKSILFIGTGMGDFQINNIFKEVKRLQGDFNQKHFIITKQSLDSSLDFLTHIPIDDHSEIELIIDTLLSIKDECKAKDSKENLLLRKQLREANKKIENLSKGNITNNTNKLLEREAFEHLSKGLEFQIKKNTDKNIEKEYKRALELKPDLYDAFNNWGVYLIDLANTKEEKEAEDLYQEAFDKFQKAIDIKPDLHETFNNWGTAIGNFAKTKEGKEAEDLYQEAFDKYRKAIEIKSNKHDAFYNWGTDLGNLAKIKEGKEAEDLYQEAFDKFQKTIDIQPDKYEAFNNWGTGLGYLANTKEGKEAEDLHQEAFDKFQKAIDIKPDLHTVFNNWGTAIGNLAKTKEGKEAEDLYEEVFDKFQKAIDIKPDLHETFNNWGTAIGNFAKTKEGKEAEDLYQEAFDKYRKAIEIKSNKHDAFYNWGTDLGNLAKIKEGKEAEDLYKEAFDKFKKAIEYGASSYNLSCIYALQKEKENALKYLNISLEKKEIDIDFVEKDKDWLLYLKDKEFIELLNKYRK